MCFNEKELYKIIPPNGVHELISSKRKEDFSPYELKKIERIASEVRYIMDSVMYNSNGRFIGGFTTTWSPQHFTKLSVQLKNKSVIIHYEENFMAFTKLEDDYILIKFVKDNFRGSPTRLVATDRTYDVRFGVICDDLDGVISFYREVMIKDDFIKKVMLGEKL